MKPIVTEVKTGILPFGPSQGSLMLQTTFEESDIENDIIEDSELVGDEMFDQFKDLIKGKSNFIPLQDVYEKYLYSGQYGDTLQGLFKGKCIPKYPKAFTEFFTRLSKESLEKQKGQSIKYLRPPFMIYNGGVDYVTITPTNPESFYESFNFLMSVVDFTKGGDFAPFALTEQEQHRLCVLLFNVSSEKHLDAIQEHLIDKNLLDMDPQRVWILVDEGADYGPYQTFCMNNNFRFAIKFNEYSKQPFFLNPLFDD